MTSFWDCPFTLQEMAFQNRDSGDLPTFKILVLGDSNVGKTCLIHRYCDRAFYATYISTIGIDCKQKVVALEGSKEKVRLRIWDTAGQERFRTLTTAYYRGAQGILLVYDITNDDSFNHLSYWLKNIEQMASPDICRILIGNKKDLVSERAVEESRARKLANSFGVRFLETSCKTGDCVDEAFNELTQQIKEVVDRKQTEKHSGLERKPSWNKEPFKKQSWCAC